MEPPLWTLLSGSNTPANKPFSDYVDISLPGLEEIAPDNDNLNQTFTPADVTAIGNLIEGVRQQVQTWSQMTC